MKKYLGIKILVLIMMVTIISYKLGQKSNTIPNCAVLGEKYLELLSVSNPINDYDSPKWNEYIHNETKLVNECNNLITK